MSYRSILVLCLIVFAQSLHAQVVPDTVALRKFYKIDKSDKIFMPLGKLSFADHVVSFKKGDPVGSKLFTKTANCLGEPDFVDYLKKPTYLSLGCNGQVTVEFKDNGFIDIDGDDLYFWEVGPSLEPFQVEVSTNGKEWIDLGPVKGGSSTVDIADRVPPTEEKTIYYFVRITDLEGFCRGPSPGADIDAIGTIGGVIKLSLQAKLLFDVDKFELKSKALSALKKFKTQLTQIPNAELRIEGHTDSDGSDEYNQGLGMRRASSVLDYLKVFLDKNDAYEYTAISYGEQEPVATNETKYGKQKNRRVEIIVIPSKEFYKPGELR